MRNAPRSRLTAAAVFAVASLLASHPLRSQEHPAKRLASIVGVAVEEYAKGVDGAGRVTSLPEVQEAAEFLTDAQQTAQRLTGARATEARMLVDSLAAAVAARRPQGELLALNVRLRSALGREGSLDLPSTKLDLAEGKAIYQRDCAACHGALGLGDGPAAMGMKTPPPAIGSRAAMHEVSPANMFRIVTLGVPGTSMPAWTALSSDQRWAVITYVNSLRTSPEQLARGEVLFRRHAPPEAASFAWQAERSDAQLAVAVRDAQTVVAAPSRRSLTDAEVSSIVAYARMLPAIVQPADAVATSTADSIDRSGRQILALLDEALGAARNGRFTDAGDRSFDAYIAFEPLEPAARAKNPTLVGRMERHFAEFKGAVKTGDLAGAQKARDAVAAGLPHVLELTRPVESASTMFLQSLLIILREGFEAILVLGAIAAFLAKTGNARRVRSLWVGAWLGVAASLATAVVLATLLAAIPAGREIVEGVTMLVAVVVLFSVSYWLVSKVEAARWQQFIREKVSEALEQGGGKALGFVAFLAVYREGAETALFYQALLNQGSSSYLPVALGIAAGAAGLAVIFAVLRRFGVKIPLRPFFAVTSGLLYFMAFVFMGKGVRELQEGNLVSLTPVPGLPSVDALGIFPTAETLIAQGVLLVLLAFALIATLRKRQTVPQPVEAPRPVATTPPAGQPQVATRIRELESMTRGLQARVDALEAELNESRAIIPGDRS